MNFKELDMSKNVTLDLRWLQKFPTLAWSTRCAIVNTHNRSDINDYYHNFIRQEEKHSSKLGAITSRPINCVNA